MARPAPKPPTITSDMVLELLRAKHEGDVFVDECKDGPTQSGSHRRLDAWAMTKSWANPRFYGYEIKVSRRDFLKDEKWRQYLPLCSDFYFVCPPHIIEVEELPPEAGLLWTSVNGTCLLTKRRAVPRDVMPPDTLFRYILMCRTQITREHWGGDRNVTYWRKWLADRKDDKDLGRACSQDLQQQYAKRVTEVEAKQRALDRRLEAFAALQEAMRNLGFDPDDYRSWHQRKVLAALGSSDEATAELEKLIHSLDVRRDSHDRDLRWIINQARQLVPQKAKPPADAPPGDSDLDDDQ